MDLSLFPTLLRSGAFFYQKILGLAKLCLGYSTPVIAIVHYCGWVRFGRRLNCPALEDVMSSVEGVHACLLHCPVHGAEPRLLVEGYLLKGRPKCMEYPCC